MFKPTVVSFESCSQPIESCCSDIKSMDSCDNLSIGVASLAVGPTQVPPAAKRHRRSASIPGDALSRNRYHRRFGRNRQSNALVRPSVVRPEVFLADTKHSFIDETALVSARSQFQFSRLNFFQSASNNESLAVAVVLPKPLSFRSDSRGIPACLSPASINHPCLQMSKSVNNSDCEAVQPSENNPERCHSQPLTTSTHVASLKRRRDDECLRPRLDFLKMREVVDDQVQFIYLFFLMT